MTVAAWRKLSRDLATSERFNQMSERARLVYCQAYPFADRDGLLPGSPTKLFAMAFPIARITVPELDECAKEIVSAVLWESLTDSTGRPLYRILRFAEYQGAAHLAREAPSKFIGPHANESNCIELDRVAGNFPSEERRGEEKRGEGMERPPSATDTIGCRNSEWIYARGPILDDFRFALNRPEWGPSNIDESEGKKAVALLQALPDRVEQLRKGHLQAISDGKKHTHLLADTIQELRNGDCSQPKRPEAVAAPTGTPAWIEEARKIAPEYFEGSK